MRAEILALMKPARRILELELITDGIPVEIVKNKCLIAAAFFNIAFANLVGLNIDSSIFKIFFCKN
ncbi:MAG: hypothetical protein HYS88_01950 [Candidatus Colwellbacteria bacterium]|nr:hypothetical protein [Candidatus Colwellbacteria bacterium]